MTRIALPDRRPSDTRTIQWAGGEAILTIGYDLSGSPREVFADCAKEGSDIQALIADFCVIVSIALQHGITPSQLGKSLAWVTDPMTGVDVPASLVGIIMREVIDSA